MVAYAVASGGRFSGLVVVPGAAALALLAGGIVLRWPGTIPWAIGAAAAAYLIGREGDELVDGWASLVGVGLLVAAELAAWSIEHDARIRARRSFVARRVATLVVLAAAALLANFLLLGTAAVAASAGVLLAAAGVAAAVGAIAIVLRLVRA